MGNRFSKQQLKRLRDTDASSPTISKKQRHEKLVKLQSEQRESELPLLLPSSDSLEKIDVPSTSGANSDLSASSTSVNGNNYYVFLSFRGPDTRKGFVDHLYQRLKAVGLRCHTNPVFRDDEDLPFGENIGENLISAIERSKVSIPVISENYTNSEWCLRELIHIMKCKESRGQMVLPVLYKVTPKDVRHLEGGFGKAFKSCKDKFEEEVKQQGPLALRKAVDLRVFETEKFADGHEGELVNELVEIILREQQHDFQPHLPVNLVAIEDHVAEVMKLVDLACPDTRLIGIWGMGGIGKTALATIIYKKLFDKFQYRSSLQDIREEINRKGVEHVQSLLISEITTNPLRSVHKFDIGIAMIQLCCENKKVLILLDDVGHQDHLDKLIGGCNFGLGSRIIITCRDKALLKSEYKSYELKEMNPEDSLILFNRCAFEGEQHPTGLTDLSRDIVATTGGLPLALKVIGSLLNGEKDQMVWRERLEKLRNVPIEDVQEKLRISYDTLKHEEKQMFLDIACFFIGTDKRIATYFWADLKFFPRTGLQILINCSLIKIDNKKWLGMHNQLRDLGRALTCPVEKKPWERNRLWDEEAMGVLQRKMENLKVLNLSRCTGLKSTPNLSVFKKLEMLILEDCIFLEEIDPSIRDVKRLVYLNLSYCERLKKLPDQLDKLENLEELLVDYTMIKEIPPCIGYLKQLKRFSACGCSQLTEVPVSLGDYDKLPPIPPSIGKLGELVVLNLIRASITGLPESTGELNKLKILNLHGSKIERLPSSIGKLQSLEELHASHCYNLEGQIHVDKGGLSSLKILDLNCTHKISGVPENLDQLHSLEHLDLRFCGELESLPKPPFSLSSLWLTCRSNELPSLSHLKHLQELAIFKCMSLQSIPELPSCIRTLSVWVCPKLERFPNLSDLEFLSKLQLELCNGLKKLDGLEAFKSLRELNLSIRPELSIGYGVDVEDAKVDNLHAISDLEQLGSLEVLNISGRKHIQVLDLSKSKHLKRLNVRDCKSLVEIRCPSKFLEHFDRHGCESLEKFPDFLPHNGHYF
ncbi:disease resistance protein RPV1-like [Eucalyptus grandis]|uniref:disease resistance protein RPV1-like n=1 Tax=Eucalyptus grandis TaxID=71139 RepID=UPI00192EB55E|nr:disease resistance protein RPV1-like [Eucalyptus grandis]